MFLRISLFDRSIISNISIFVKEKDNFFDRFVIKRSVLKILEASKTDHMIDSLQIMTRLDKILQSFNRRSIDLHWI